MKSRNVVQFICYSPKIYSGFDRFNIVLAQKLRSCGYNLVLVFSGDISIPSLLDDINALQIRLEYVSLRNKWTTVWEMFRIFRKYKPVVVHSHFDNFIQLASAFLSGIFPIKHFVTFHSTISLFTTREYIRQKGIIKRLLLKGYYRFLLRSSLNICCVSEAIRSQFVQFSGINSAKIIRLYLGVEMNSQSRSKEEVRAELHLPSTIPMVCTVAAIEPIKGLDILIEAVSLMVHKYRIVDFKCCHIGGLRFESAENEIYFQSLKNKVAELKIMDHFVWLGERNDVPEILAGFDIYVQPSLREGLGVALMEAAANALPLIGSNVGGIPEIIHHGHNGFLVQPENPQKLAEYIKELIFERERRQEMGNNSLSIVASEFNLEKQTEKLISHYGIC